MKRDIRNEVCYKECVKVIEDFKDNREYMQSVLVAVVSEMKGTDISYVLDVFETLSDDYWDKDVLLSRDIYLAFRQYKAFLEYSKVLPSSDQ